MYNDFEHINFSELLADCNELIIINIDKCRAFQGFDAAVCHTHLYGPPDHTVYGIFKHCSNITTMVLCDFGIRLNYGLLQCIL